MHEHKEQEQIIGLDELGYERPTRASRRGEQEHEQYEPVHRPNEPEYEPIGESTGRSGQEDEQHGVIEEDEPEYESTGGATGQSGQEDEQYEEMTGKGEPENRETLGHDEPFDQQPGTENRHLR